MAIPAALGIWALTRAGVVAAGLQLGPAGLTGWGIIVLAASVTATAAGGLLAARRRPASSPGARSHSACRPARTPADSRS